MGFFPCNHDFMTTIFHALQEGAKEAGKNLERILSAHGLK